MRRTTTFGLGMAALLLLASCQSVPDPTTEADALALLPGEQSAYALLNTARAPGFTRELSAAAPDSEQSELMRNLLRRSEQLAFTLQSDGAAAFAARGSYPRGSIRFSLGGNREWERATASAEGGTLTYWQNRVAPLELVMPTRNVMAGALGGPAGGTARRLLKGQARTPVPTEAAEKMRAAAFSVYSAEPTQLLSRGSDAARSAGTEDGGETAGTAGSSEAPAASLFTALQGAVQSRLLESLDSLLLLMDAADDDGGDAAATAADSSDDAGAAGGAERLATRIELAFADERSARVSLVIVRLSLANLLAELERFGLVPTESATNANSVRVERDGTIVRIGPIPVNGDALAQVALPLFSPLRYD